MDSCTKLKLKAFVALLKMDVFCMEMCSFIIVMGLRAHGVYFHSDVAIRHDVTSFSM
jgi:hypothetical protein